MRNSALHHHFIPVLAVLAITPACSADPDGPVTYHQDAAPILERYCTGCHYQGGIGPFSLTDYQSAKNNAEAIQKDVTSGKMPPWMPSDAGLPLRYSRRMRPADRDLLLRWIETGARAGDPQVPARTDIPPAETADPPRADLRLDPGAPYLPDARVTDDYRCFVLGAELPADIYVQAGTIQPDQASMVHHVIVFQIPADGVPKVRALEHKDAQPGYKCFGGAGADESARVILAWAPGATITRFPSGTALKVSAGSLLVMQVHYNLLKSAGASDRTLAELEISHTPPQRIAQIWPVADPQGLRIAAGDARARQQISLRVGLLSAYFGLPIGDIMLYGNAPHMHLIGKRIVTSVEDGPVLLEVPRWDFHWQQGYLFQVPYLVHADNHIAVECDYDNSAAGQPVIDGQQRPPRDLKWGESTTDEMCLSFLYVAPAPK